MQHICNLPIKWISDGHGRKQKYGTEEREKSREPKKPGNGNDGEKLRQLDSQQHVLLVLLENRSDVLEDLRVKQVDTTVDDVAHKGAWFFHVMQHLESEQAS